MTDQDPRFWQDLLLHWMHDPADKALDIRGHVSRAARYYSAATGQETSAAELKNTADAIASYHERLPVPYWKLAEETIVGPAAGQLEIRHPLSGEACALRGFPAAIDEGTVVAAIKRIVKDCNTAPHRFLAIWRRLIDELQRGATPEAGRLPAETRAPDHTIWNHLDTTTAFAAASHPSKSAKKAWGLLSFKLSPVQTFIRDARSTRDVFAGSFLLAWLVFRAMEPILEELGPTAFVYPSLRGAPLMDWWLAERKVPGVAAPPPDRLLLANFPNRFLAVVPDGDSEHAGAELGKRVEAACQAAWMELADAVHQYLGKREPFSQTPGWDLNWDAQVRDFFHVQTTFLPWASLDSPNLYRDLFGKDSLGDLSGVSESLAKIQKAIQAKGHANFYDSQIGKWQFLVQLSALVMEAASRVKHIPAYRPQPDSSGFYPQKCTLLGTYEQMGPGDRAANDEFWKKAQQKLQTSGLREGERLCAVSLVKRFAFQASLNRTLGIDRDDVRFPDTATVAATLWLRKAKIDPDADWGAAWSGQWLHAQIQKPKDETEEAVPEAAWASIRDARKSDSAGKPPTYYAILLMDGDSLGEWLSARHPKSPTLQQAYAKPLLDYFSGLDIPAGQFERKRPVGPALHASISEALGHFSTLVVPRIVKHFHGELVYAGGDDVLAFLPTATALACARALQLAYQGRKNDVFGEAEHGWLKDNGRMLLTMGPHAGISAGLAIAHYHEDLRVALDHARAAESLAKKAIRHDTASACKNRIALTVAKRSGEVLTRSCEWDFIPDMQRFLDTFLGGASDAWVRQIAPQASFFETLGEDCMRAEIARAIRRSEERNLFDVDETLDSLSLYRSSYARREGDTRTAGGDFLDLVHAASFLARGRDE